MRLYASFQVKILFFFLFSFFCTLPLLAGDDDDDDDTEETYGPSGRYNFGVVVHNQDYQIYRSGKLGKWGLKYLESHLEEEGLSAPNTIVYMNRSGYVFPTYFAIKQYEYSLSGKYGFFEFFHSFGELRTYVDGHNPYFPEKDIDSRAILGPRGQKYFEFKDDGIDGGMDAFMAVMDLVLDPARQPVLFHCFGGMHRTGMVGMALRYIQGGYWTEGPLVDKHGFMLNPAEQEYLLYNPVFFREGNIKFIRQFRSDPRFLDLKDRYQEVLQDDESWRYTDFKD